MAPAHSLFQPFRCALRGVVHLVRGERHARFHLVATLLVAALGLVLGVSRLEWGLLILAVALVWIAEGLNAAVESLGDHLAPARHPAMGRVKDLAAGAVLLAAVGAAGVGLLVFLPYLIPGPPGLARP